jgi:adenylosuccinate lyase
MFDYSTYLSPFTWRYGSPEMRKIWSENHKRLTWRKIWLALAAVQAEYCLVQPEQVDELSEHLAQVNIARSLEIEKEIQHDLMAEIRAFAEQCPRAGSIIHLGATSMDIEDNADVLRLRESLRLLESRLARLLTVFAGLVDQWADTPIMAFTHLQPAEPSTLGCRLALYTQDLLQDWDEIRRQTAGLRGKGFKGAVGTSASYAELIGAENLSAFEDRLGARLGLTFYPVTGQTYPRKQDFYLLNALAGLGASLYKFAFDLRVLQSPPIGELAEPFGARQVGSSAMPFKRNPINAEKIDSLARQLAQFPRVAWDNAAHSLLERTLDDSANRRSLLPEAFLIADELLLVATKLVSGLRVNQPAVAANLAAYGPFAATEKVLMAVVKGGGDRQAAHERLRELALSAWAAVQSGQSNPLAAAVCAEPTFLGCVSAEELARLMTAAGHVGRAPQAARETAAAVRAALAGAAETPPA